MQFCIIEPRFLHLKDVNELSLHFQCFITLKFFFPLERWNIMGTFDDFFQIFFPSLIVFQVEIFHQNIPDALFLSCDHRGRRLGLLSCLVIEYNVYNIKCIKYHI